MPRVCGGWFVAAVAGWVCVSKFVRCKTKAQAAFCFGQVFWTEKCQARSGYGWPKSEDDCLWSCGCCRNWTEKFKNAKSKARLRMRE